MVQRCQQQQLAHQTAWGHDLHSPMVHSYCQLHGKGVQFHPGTESHGGGVGHLGGHLQPLVDVVELGHCLQGLHGGAVPCSEVGPDLVDLQEVLLDWLVLGQGVSSALWHL